MADKNNSNDVVKALLMLLSLCFAIVLIVLCLYLHPEKKLTDLFMDCAPGAIVTLIALPVVYFLYLRLGIQGDQVDHGRLADLVADRLSQSAADKQSLTDNMTSFLTELAKKVTEGPTTVPPDTLHDVERMKGSPASLSSFREDQTLRRSAGQKK